MKWPRLKPLRRDASPSEIVGKINALLNRENVRNGYANDPRGEIDPEDVLASAKQSIHETHS